MHIQYLYFSRHCPRHAAEHGAACQAVPPACGGMTRAMPRKSPTMYIPGLTAAKRHALVTAATRAVDTKARRGRQPQHSYFCTQRQGQGEVAEAGGGRRGGWVCMENIVMMKAFPLPRAVGLGSPEHPSPPVPPVRLFCVLLFISPGRIQTRILYTRWLTSSVVLHWTDTYMRTETKPGSSIGRSVVSMDIAVTVARVAFKLNPCTLITFSRWPNPSLTIFSMQ